MIFGFWQPKAERIRKTDLLHDCQSHKLRVVYAEFVYVEELLRVYLKVDLGFVSMCSMNGDLAAVLSQAMSASDSGVI